MADTHEEAVEFLRLSAEAESANRSRAAEDLRFGYGDQWPAYATAARKGTAGGTDRPMLTINETDAYIRQVCNQQRQQRPRIKVHAVGNGADAKKAKVIQGLIRHNEVAGYADHAYDTAFESAVRMGWGYFGLYADYIAPDSFDQDIFFRVFDNPFTVYFDPNSVLPDGSDATRALVTDEILKEQFKQENPGAQMDGFTERASGDTSPEWVTKESIRVAEFYRIESVADQLFALSTGKTAWKSELDKPGFLAALKAAGIEVQQSKSRSSFRKIVKWSKVTGVETLDEKILPGRWIPIIPVYGSTLVLDGKRVRSGLIRLAKDPQILVNFETSAFAESVALAPKAKWLLAEKQDEGFENEWAQANTAPTPILHYVPVLGPDGQPAPPPQRLQPESPPEGIMAAMMHASTSLQKVLGMFDPEIQAKVNKSGRAINAEKQQSDQSNFHYYDNTTRSLAHAGRIILSWTPAYYDVQRTTRIIGDDGRPSIVTLNEKKTMDGIEQVLNDVRVGDYDVVMDTGPGYNSKREQAVDMMTTIFAKDPELMKVAGDLYFRAQDWDGADVIADRLAAMNPMAQTDENSDVPQSAQIMIKGLQQKVQQLTQALQQAALEMKYKGGIEQMKQDGETKRALMSETAKAHDIEMRDSTKRHDVEMRALTGLGEAELDGLVKILVEHMKTSREKDAGARDAEAFERQAEHEMSMAKQKADSTEPTGA